MSKNSKIFLGILTILPLIGLLLTLSLFFSAFLNLNRRGAPDAVALSNNIGSMLIITVILTFLSLGLMIYYIVHAVNNKSISNDERLIWILLFIFLSHITFIIYWVMRIWNDNNNNLYNTLDSNVLDDEI
jgi:ABC-type multidrug transport system permease subunit